MPRDLYDVLGVARDSGDAEIKKAFRALARELHPDVNRHDPEAEEKFKEAAEAYEVLADPERRRTYDAYGHEGLRRGGWSPHAADSGGFEDILSAFFGRGDPLFADLFGGGRRGPAPGGDIGASVEITLAEVLAGTKREVSFDAVATCGACRGNGADPGTPIHTCETCGGAGQVQQVTRTPFGQMMRTAPCPACGGEGKIPETPCAECSGKGRTVKRRTFEVDIPAGIEAGQRIRVAGGGHAGEAGAPDGNLYVEVAVVADERFERHGEHLVAVARIPATRAMLGGEISVPTLDGDRTVEVPAGAQPGETVLIQGAGLPGLHGPPRGDQHVVLDVVIPSDLDGSQQELASQLDETITPEQLASAPDHDAGRRWGRRRRRARR